MKTFSNFHVIDHPLIQHKITLIRDKSTGPKVFRELVKEVATLVAFELTRGLAATTTKIESTGKNDNPLKVFKFSGFRGDLEASLKSAFSDV